MSLITSRILARYHVERTQLANLYPKCIHELLGNTTWELLTCTATNMQDPTLILRHQNV